MSLIQLSWLVAGASMLGAASRVSLAPLPWIALPLLLRATRTARPVIGLPALWLLLSVSFAFFKRGIVPVPGPAYAAIMGLEALTATLPFAADRLVAPLVPRTASTLVFPMAWVAIEFLHSRLTPAASWGSIAYSQYGNLGLMQLAAVTGIWGISFVVAWFASVLELAWTAGFQASAIARPVLAYVAVAGAIVAGGSLRVALAPPPRATLRAAAVRRPVGLFGPGEMTRITEGRVSPEERARVQSTLVQLQDAFLESSRREARAGARLIVWPEGNLLVFVDEEAGFLERARGVAAAERVYLAIGMATIHLGERLPFENKLVVIDPAGDVAMSYRKSHPVAGWEAGIMRPGEPVVPIADAQDYRMAGAICFDSDFPEFIRQAGRNRADLLVVPANDWKEIKELHAQMLAFRAIENGLSIVRSASSGLSVVVDPYGRTLAISDDLAPGDSTMTGQVPIARVGTVYARTGDLLAWACVAGLVLAIGAGLIRRTGDGITVSASRAAPSAAGAGAAASAADR